MFDLSASLLALALLLTAATLTWLVSVLKRDVSIVDVLWGVMFLVAALAYASSTSLESVRETAVVALIAAWALRLSGYIAWRNHGQPEDRRYQEIRRRNEPNFTIKSLYLVFWLQAGLAWVISLPALAAINSSAPWSALDYIGVALALGGLAIEATADAQLARFRGDPANRGRVLDRGMWRYSRHPNYFGEFCFWWGVYLLALSAGGWWSIAGPLLISFLLLRVSGVVLLEKDIGERRPAYADYRARTNAFFPGPPRGARGAA